MGARGCNKVRKELTANLGILLWHQRRLIYDIYTLHIYERQCIWDDATKQLALQEGVRVISDHASLLSPEYVTRTNHSPRRVETLHRARHGLRGHTNFPMGHDDPRNLYIC